MTINPGDQAEYDQNSATLSELIGSMWWQLFCNLRKQGFNAEQSLRLVSSYIQATCGKPPSTDDSPAQPFEE